MQNFIKKLDLLYEKSKSENDIAKNDKRFAIFCPLKIKLYNDINMNYIIRKSEFTKYLYIKNGARVYFSDADILTMLLQIKEKDIVGKVVESLEKLYKGKGEMFSFYVDEDKYEAEGIPVVFCTQMLNNPQDIDIPFEDLFTLINMVLAKDAASMLLWDNNPEFLKHTIVKYILLSKYYYFNNEKVKKFLDEVGYDTEYSIYINYSTSEKRKKNNKIFYDFDKIENEEILWYSRKGS